MEMPDVRQCLIEDCAYNVDQVCHAMAISVGDSSKPVCNSFCHYLMDAKAGDMDCIAKVGSCKESDCVYNICLECQADEIVVDLVDTDPQCMTFKTDYIDTESKTGVSSKKSDADLSCLAPEVFIG